MRQLDNRATPDQLVAAEKNPGRRTGSGNRVPGQASRFHISYVGVNSIKINVRSRTKDAIDCVRHVFIETDGDGAQLLATLAGRRDLPTPSYIIESSPNRLHVLWRVTGFTTDRIEWLQKCLARELGTDTAATSCSQTTRVPG